MDSTSVHDNRGCRYRCVRTRRVPGTFHDPGWWCCRYLDDHKPAVWRSAGLSDDCSEYSVHDRRLQAPWYKVPDKSDLCDDHLFELPRRFRGYESGNRAGDTCSRIRRRSARCRRRPHLKIWRMPGRHGDRGDAPVTPYGVLGRPDRPVLQHNHLRCCRIPLRT